jgi:hypothetical protein
MAVISKGHTFATGDQVTALKLNNLADAATFASGAVDSVSTQLSGGAIIVKDGGVTTAKIADNAVTTAKIADSNVTKAKIENVANMKVLGNTSGSAAAPQEVAILDEDTMSSNSATSLATQQSIKAYVDDLVDEYSLKEPASNQTGTFNVTTSFSDFDISNAVGSNKALVIMEVDSTYAGGSSIFFRTKGEDSSGWAGNTNAGWGASGVTVGSSSLRGGTIVCVTDSNGYLEAYGNNAATINYKILAYQKLR